ncbi:alanine/glycine:cation symporter family protein [Adlercreutzia murintestinalis]|uniref:alanine/glycine:cation symporter family protein n=1 Tax=Adlercreutzia murintestinalis TaxID=2941325 RepID=UPI00203C4633|nr:sodium:alanine symporter family protein [Adlercreutzia murintestinalis]
MEEALLGIVTTINNYLSNYVLIILLLGMGLWFSIRTRFVQFRCFGEGWRRLFGDFSLRGGDQGGAMTSFQALSTAVAAQVGTGNIVGACGAIIIGGPGAIFWMWIIALLGMATNYAEAVMAQKTRITDPDGTVHGGPVYYITTAFKGKGGKFLAGFFAVAIILALGFMGCMVQSNSIAETMNNAFGVPTWVIGLLVVVLAGFVFVGGVSRLAAVTEKIVPVMAILYVIGSLVILIMNAPALPATFALIFECAFNPQASVGGATFGIIAAISQGAKRGLFSNEAGMGSTPHAHALAEVREPHEQGVVAMIGVFVDTIVVVTMTALVVLSTMYVGDGTLATGDYMTLTAETVTKTNIAQLAFGKFFGADLGAWFVAICLLFFAFSTILSWNLFAKLNVEWLFGKKAVLPFTIVALAFIFLGSLLSNELVWELADMFNQLMVLPNAIALFALSAPILAIANARHDKRASDVGEEKLEDQERAAAVKVAKELARTAEDEAAHGGSDRSER